MPEDRSSRRAAELRRRAAERTPAKDAAAPDIEVAALRYDSENEHAPKMIARGRGHAAQKILELAAEHDIPVTKDPTLVSILGALDVGAEIPPDLYGVIAEVLAWAYHSDKAVGVQRELARRNKAA
jgi:flagellar biosynthesis protein